MVWRPLLTGGLAASARDAIRAIAEDLSRCSLGADASLATGHAGLAIFHAYAERAGIIDAGSAAEHLDKALAIVETSATSPTLFGGFVGVAWAAEHLGAAPAADDGDAGDSDVDDMLVRYASVTPWTGGYDLLYGLTGIGIYALERGPRPLAERLRQEIAARLEELAEPMPCGGVALPTREDHMPDNWRARFPLGNYNLGVAHGIPGVIGLLGGVAGDRARALRQALSTMMQRIRAPAPDGSLYGWYVDRRDRSHHNTGCRAAWCYGDPGIAAALLRSARAAGDPAQEALALEIARAAVARQADTVGVVDASLCHGAACLLHLFNRLHQATGEPAFGEAALGWAKRALEMRRPGHGIGGFRHREMADGAYHNGDLGLVEGAAGIGLALLAAVGEIEPRWDIVLLCDIPSEQLRCSADVPGQRE